MQFNTLLDSVFDGQIALVTSIAALTAFDTLKPDTLIDLDTV